MSELKMRLSRPSINPGKGSLLTNLLSNLRGRRGGGGRSYQSSQEAQLLSDETLSKLTLSEKQEYLSNAKVQRALTSRRKLESDLEYRAFQKDRAIFNENRAERQLAFDQSKESFDRNKELVYKSIELLNKAKANGNMAMQNNLIASMENFLPKLDPHMQALLAPVIQSGPFSKKAQNMRKWDRQNPTPQVTADPVLEPHLAALQYNDLFNHGQARGRFELGDSFKSTKPGIIKMSENNYAVLGKKPYATDIEGLKIDAFAQKFNTTPAHVMTHGGFKSEDIEAEVDGVKTKYGFLFGIDGKVLFENRGEKLTGRSEDAREAIAIFNTWDTLDKDTQTLGKNSIAAEAKELIENKGWKPEKYSEEIFFPRYKKHFILRPDGTATAVAGSKETLRGKKVIINDLGRVFTSRGELLGDDLEKADEELRFREEKESVIGVNEQEYQRLAGATRKKLHQKFGPLLGD